MTKYKQYVCNICNEGFIESDAGHTIFGITKDDNKCGIDCCDNAENHLCVKCAYSVVNAIEQKINKKLEKI